MLALVTGGTIGAAVLGGWAWWKVQSAIRLFNRREHFSRSSLLEDLPSVSVCIPARNERHAMTQCLERVLGSSYPKLEVIVCDDSSVDGTSSLIKAFARDGVRFVEGTSPPPGWLGKNNALNSLLSEASGTYVLFLDVDTFLTPDSIGQLVAYIQSSGATMVSVLPVRRDSWRVSVLLAPLRYFWRLLLHSRRRPIAASSAWMVHRGRFLAEFSDFSRFKSAVEPEVEIAQYFSKQSLYRFLVSYDLLGVSYEKKLSSQIETSVRLRFPLLNYSITRALLWFVMVISVMVFPFLALISGVLWLVMLGAVSASVLYFAYYAYLRRVWHRGAYVGALLLPAVLLLDAYVLLRSMVQYLTRTVTWKGRPISPLFASTLHNK